MDPLKKSVIGDFPEFEVYKIDMPPWLQNPKVSDREDKLQNAEIKFKNQIHGPESIAFNPQGRGPYTRVADGRVIFCYSIRLFKTENPMPRPIRLKFIAVAVGRKRHCFNKKILK